MKIAFLGDSITKGIPRVSYFEMLEKELNQFELTNYGKGGDTVLSLYKRMKKIKDLETYDLVFLFIGVNDVYSKLNVTHEVFKLLRGQVWSKSSKEFEEHYQNLIHYLNKRCKKIVVIPPLLFGEDLSSSYNIELQQFIDKIKKVLLSYTTIDYLDVFSAFRDYLEGKVISDYIPDSILRTGLDVTVFKTNKEADEASQERGLHLTLDGVHLNSTGASIVSNHIVQYINNFKGRV